MSSPVTEIRLITLDDAEAITAHLGRDAQATARWDPARSPDYYTRQELGLHRAEASTQIENTASQNVLRKNGFVPIGIARARIFTEGAWHDEILWELLLDE